MPLWFGDADGFVRHGTVLSVSAERVSVRAPGLCMGAAVHIDRHGRSPALAEVMAVDGGTAVCTALTDIAGVVPGSAVHSTLARVTAFTGAALLGADVDAWGRSSQRRAARVVSPSVALVRRAPITRALSTGVPAIDAFTTIGYGQRIALVAGAGAGKTTLLRRLIEHTDVHARVVALVGERGREAAELIAAIRRGGARRSVTTVCATAEKSPSERIAAVRTATAHAQTLASAGKDVLLVVDSLTRVATAWRELALANGEPPAQRGHPASLASMLAAIVERAGAFEAGSITAVYAVLVEGDDHTEPISDTLRALLDGHVVLSRKAAQAGRFPAVDVLRSLSRLMANIAVPAHNEDAACVRAALAALEEAEDLFAIGAYKAGADPRLDAALAVRDAIDRLVFSGDRAAALSESAALLSAIASRLRASARKEQQ